MLGPQVGYKIAEVIYVYDLALNSCFNLTRFGYLEHLRSVIGALKAERSNPARSLPAASA
ncbi:unnamed protein product [marine sediment metagenome]|uniref:Uncharacterized protein n=1 Tax=marine sediment metagenome TaxID=412755 RepID=X1EXZ4_9ZZZZ